MGTRKKLFHEKSKWLKKVDILEETPAGHPAGLFYPKICCDILYVLSGNFAEGKNKIITDEIKSSNIKFKKAFIRAFFDDEGSIQSDSHTMRFHQDRKDMLEDVRKMLNEIGIKSNEVRSYIKRDKLRYYFNITGFREYYNYYNIIGCTSSNKKREFELLINKVSKSKYFKEKYSL